MLRASASLLTCRQPIVSGGRAQAIEEVARALELPYLLLCSTDDPVTRNTWHALGFSLSSEQVGLFSSLLCIACCPNSI